MTEYSCDIHEKNGKTPFMAFFLLFALAFSSLSAQDIVYRNRISGDQSFIAEDYPVAASFYAQYAKEAEENGDKDSIRDAYERQIDALILGKMADMAARLLNEYELRYPGVNPLSLSMWKADLKNLEKNPKEAIRILQRIMPGLTAEDPRRLRALSSLAAAQELDHNFFGAADTYQNLMRTAAKSPLEKTAFERKVFCLASTDTPALALLELQNTPHPLNEADLDAMRLLTIYALIRTEGFANIKAAWKKAIVQTKEYRNPVLYALFSAIGDQAMAANRADMAQEAYQRAFTHALNKSYAYETIRKLISLLDQSKEPGKAAELAQKSIDLFKGPYAAPEAKLQTARIFRNAEKFEEAEDLYRNLAKDPAATKMEKQVAVLECAYLLNSLKKEREAEEFLRSYFNEPEQKGELDFLLADLLARRNEYEKAALAFSRTGKSYPDFYRKAQYQSALAWFHAKKYKECIGAAEELVSKEPDTVLAAQASYLKGLALESIPDSEGAKKAFAAYASHPKAESEKAAKALFKTALIAFSQKKPQEAEKIFSDLAARFPKSPQAPAALYWRIFSFQSRGDEIQAERETWLLADRYPDSRYAIEALFNLASHYADAGASVRANSVLNNLLKRIKTPALQAKILMEKANIAFRSGEPETALLLLKRLYANYPQSPVLADAYYLNADLLKQKGEYEQAIHFYNEVLLHKPETIVELAAVGSIADCQFLMASAQNKPEWNKEALIKYNQILSKSEIPEPMRVMTLYKSGRCEEQLGNDDKAIERYKTAMYYLSPNGASATELWATKAVEAIASIAEKRPLKAHIEAAIAALQKLADTEHMEPEFVDERILRLEKLKYKP